jgi:hypothetical protein
MNCIAIDLTLSAALLSCGKQGDGLICQHPSALVLTRWSLRFIDVLIAVVFLLLVVALRLSGVV